MVNQKMVKSKLVLKRGFFLIEGFVLFISQKYIQ